LNPLAIDPLYPATDLQSERMEEGLSHIGQKQIAETTIEQKRLNVF
jgi:hypothetical protein